MICPACGQPIDEHAIAGNLDLMEEIDLTPQQRAIFSVLAKRLGKWVRRDAVIHEMYENVRQ